VTVVGSIPAVRSKREIYDLLVGGAGMLVHIPASKISREMVKRFAIRRSGLIIRRSACSLNGKAARYEGGCWNCSSQVKRQAGNDLRAMVA